MCFKISNDLYTAHHNLLGIWHQLKVRHLYGTFNFSTRDRKLVCLRFSSLFAFRGKRRPLRKKPVFTVARKLAKRATVGACTAEDVSCTLTRNSTIVGCPIILIILTCVGPRDSLMVWLTKYVDCSTSEWWRHVHVDTFAWVFNVSSSTWIATTNKVIVAAWWFYLRKDDLEHAQELSSAYAVHLIYRYTEYPVHRYSTLNVKRNVSLLQSDIHYNPSDQTGHISYYSYPY